MDTRVRTALQIMKAPSAPPKQDNELEREKKTEGQKKRLMGTGKGLNRGQSRREKKIALQQDVDKLRKKLRHEENVHKALERAFTRPLGALPRLPPYLPSYTLELLAEVAVLEEEVVRLEEQVVNFRQGLYQEAIYISSSSQNSGSFHQSKPCSLSHNADASIIGSNPSASMRWSTSNMDSILPSSNHFSVGKRILRNPNSCLDLPEEQCGKENQLNANFTKNSKQSPTKKVTRTRLLPMSTEMQINAKKERVEDNCRGEEASVPNKLGEDILNCLLSIFTRMSVPKKNRELETPLSISGSSDSLEDHLNLRDPYRIGSEFGQRDVGPYKDLCAIDASSIDPNLITRFPFLTRRLKLLFRKLTLVELSALTHQQKLAFWINIYNSCMMNAFLEHGIPTSPQMVVAMMAKAMINVGGHLLSAMTIEHFILRLPYHSKHTYPKGSKRDETTTRVILGLEWSEPLVTFALSCGSWSSPTVRVYKAAQVEKELEAAKRDYLQAAVGIGSLGKFAIPKLLDWYLLDFAKDVESLMDWICSQLPSELRTEAVRSLEIGRRNVVPQPVHVMPYEFRFRYLLAP